jgi:ribonuclease-3
LRLPGFLRVTFHKEKDLLVSLRNILGFYPGNIHIYQLAFRHRSAALEVSNGKKISNERMEYLGDAVLGAVIADYLFHKYPFKDEGYLTQMRSKFVSRASLNKVSEKMGLEKLLTIENDNNFYRSKGGDAFEALIGAIYLDKGYHFTRHVILERIIRLYLDPEELENQELNYKSKLIEYIQKEKITLEFNVVEEVGKGYSKQYVVEVSLNGKPSGRGMGRSIKEAEQAASEQAWMKIAAQLPSA